MNIKLNNIEIALTTNIKLDNYKKPQEQWWNSILAFLEAWANDSPYIKISTSGSTGRAKVLKYKKIHLWNSAEQTCKYFNLNKNSNALLCLSADYIAGKMMLVRAMVSQMNLVCVKPQINPIEQITKNIDFAAMVPMQVQKTAKNLEQLNKIKNLIVGGGKVSDQLVIQLSGYKGNAFETFGMTETLSHIALKQLTPTKQKFFTPMSGVELSKTKDNTLIINCLKIGVNNLKTNDIVEINRKGEFLWLGRTDFLINTGGVKVSPEQIENKISKLINQPFLILGKPDSILGEKIVLLIEGKPMNTKNLFEKIKQVLKQYEIPKQIIFVNKLIRTKTEKIDRINSKSLLL